MNCETIVVGPLETDCYIVHCTETKECVIVDPGADPGKIIHFISESGLLPKVILNTHGHVDHVGANRDMKEKYDVPLLIHEADEGMLNHSIQSQLSFLLGAKKSPDPDGFLEENQIITVGNSKMEVLHTPGHSPGSVCFLAEDFLLSGDTLFCGGVGRTDLPGGSWGELERSIKEKILILPEELKVFPGHGPSSTVGQEKHSNPFIR
ncbi:MBL fold metallo-hydrolase [Acidobacteriota bacterium]